MIYTLRFLHQGPRWMKSTTVHSGGVILTERGRRATAQSLEEWVRVEWATGEETIACPSKGSTYYILT